MIGLVLLSFFMLAGTWLTLMSIKIKEEERTADREKYFKSRYYLTDLEGQIEVLTSAKEGWLKNYGPRRRRSLGADTPKKDSNPGRP